MTDFLRPFLALRNNVKLRTSPLINHVQIDNLVFRLHYRHTAILLFLCSVLVTSRQYIGEHIKCIVGGRLNPRVVSSYCFFTSTFTIVEYVDTDLVENGTLPHLGVGPYALESKSPVIHHAYYQWVPFMLFAQATMFILTHLLWKKWEGGKLKALLVGIQNASYSFAETEMRSSCGPIPTVEKKREGIELIKNKIIKSHYVSRFWPVGLAICEALNVVHVYFQMYLTNKFLGGIFWSLGPNLLDGSLESQTLLDTNFPKVTKCSFQMYGPSGTIQRHDVLCVMALNVMNEKIYSVLWFWFVILLVISTLNLVWRLATYLLHGRSSKFNRYVFSSATPGKLNTLTEVTMTDHLAFKDWLFLRYLGRNVDGLLFKEIINELTDGLHQDISVDNPDEMYKLHQ
ncbi:innexin inx7-like [Coccinella septempunctata]|uniref:innexin inx7-like n=1 Tax=Coccinella septempunctata TaxID=41139 RepID=UPI001D0990EF|nr:innexin inx7-like [Coccinella septempunctata]XP_044762929.1 innexin inx7-like [Coccinella septempunctata]XP_044762930.1 innexin inx7-like [Coccinella septempunctata]